MRITIKDKKVVPIGTTRKKQKFLWFFKIMKKSKESEDFEFRWLCRSSWLEEMCEWVEYPPDSVGGGYKPLSKEPNTYGWKTKYWLD